MKDPTKTMQAQSREMASLRKRIAELEQAASQSGQIEERLRGSEQRLRGMIENAQSGYFFVDRDGIYRQVNDAWLRMHKYHLPDEIIGRHFSVTQVDADLGKAQRVVEGLLAGNPVPTGEFSRRCRDGSIGHHTFSASPVFSNHEVIGLEGFLIDTTDHKKAIDALRESEETYRTLFSNMAQGSFYQRSDGMLVDVNPAALAMFGLTRDQFLGRTSYDPAWKVVGVDGSVLSPERHPSMLALRTGKPVNNAVIGVFSPERESYVWMNINAIPQFRIGDDRPYQVFVTLHDITEQRQMQEALRESELFLKETQMIARLGGWKANPHTDYLEWSEGVYSIIEAPRDYAPGFAEGRKYFPPEYAPVLRGKLIDCLKTGAPFQVELLVITDTGKRRWAEIRGLAPVIEGERSYVVGTLQDITERKEMELALRDSEERFRLFMDNSPTIAWIKDEQGRYVYLSKTLEKRFGVRGKDWIGKTDAELWPPEIAENFRKNDMAVLAAGHPIEVTEQTINADGNRSHWLNSKFPFCAAGNFYIAGIGLDITARKKAEEEVRFLSQVVEQSTDSIVCSDAEFRIIYMNRSAEKLFGWSKEELLGKTPDIFNAEPAADEIQKEIYASLLSGKAYLGEALNRRKDGSTFYCQFLVSPLFDIDGRLIGSIGSQRDITDRKKAQDELATHRERLEDLVRERTRELEDKTQILEELNAATRALLRQREEDRKELEERFVANMKNLILPYAEKMKRTRLDERQTSYLGIMETHLNEIMSPLMRTMQHHNFTPTEAQVASLIKDGKATKDIAEIMGIATSSIDTHRKSIRKKLGLSNAKVNLQSHLRSLGI